MAGPHVLRQEDEALGGRVSCRGEKVNHQQCLRFRAALRTEAKNRSEANIGLYSLYMLVPRRSSHKRQHGADPSLSRRSFTVAYSERSCLDTMPYLAALHRGSFAGLGPPGRLRRECRKRQPRKCQTAVPMRPHRKSELPPAKRQVCHSGTRGSGACSRERTDQGSGAARWYFALWRYLSSRPSNERRLAVDCIVGPSDDQCGSCAFEIAEGTEGSSWPTVSTSRRTRERPRYLTSLRRRRSSSLQRAWSSIMLRRVLGAKVS